MSQFDIAASQSQGRVMKLSVVHRPDYPRLNMPIMILGLGVDGGRVLKELLDNIHQHYTFSPEDANVYFQLVTSDVEPLPDDLSHAVNAGEIIHIPLRTRAYPSLAKANADTYPFLAWWYKLGQPETERAGARFSVFSDLADTPSRLSESLLRTIKNKGIKLTYIVTSLTDVTGSAIMWDICHLLRSQRDQANNNVTVLWLAFAGSNLAPRNRRYQRAAWYELERLSLQHDSQILFTAGDIESSNSTLHQTGPDHLMLMGNHQDVRDFGRAGSALPLLTDALTTVLDPIFRDKFISDLHSSAQGTNVSSMGLTVLQQSMGTLRELLGKRLLYELLFSEGGAFRGVFVNGDNQQTMTAQEWLRRIPGEEDFFSVLTGRTPKRNLDYDIERTTRAYSEHLIRTITQNLYVPGSNRVNPLEGTLQAQLEFLQALVQEVWERAHADFYRIGSDRNARSNIDQILTNCHQMTKSLAEQLGRWLEIFYESAVPSRRKRGGLTSRTAYRTTHSARITIKRRLEIELNELRHRFLKHFTVGPSHRILVPANTDVENIEDLIYQAWLQNQMDQEYNSLLRGLFTHLEWRIKQFDKQYHIELMVYPAEYDPHAPFPPFIGQVDERPNSLLQALETLTRSVVQGAIRDSDFEQAVVGKVLPMEVRAVQDKHGLPFTLLPNPVAYFMAQSRKVVKPHFKISPLQKIDLTERAADLSLSWPGRFTIATLKRNIDVGELFEDTPPRPQSYRDSIFTAEQMALEIEQEVQREKGYYNNDPFSISPRFAALLSDPSMARRFVLGLLYGCISEREPERYFWQQSEGTPIPLNERRLGIFADCAALSAMENFVIRLPNDVPRNHLLHGANRRWVFRELDDQLDALRRENTLTQHFFDGRLSDLSVKLETQDRSKEFESERNALLEWAKLLVNAEL